MRKSLTQRVPPAQRPHRDPGAHSKSGYRSKVGRMSSRPSSAKIARLSIAMRKLHLIAGLLGILVFVLSGQAMRLHKPPIKSLAGGKRMMFLSRHIYILGSALVNLTLGLSLKLESL